jgi:hypothetical protein
MEEEHAAADSSMDRDRDDGGVDRAGAGRVWRPAAGAIARRRLWHDHYPRAFALYPMMVMWGEEYQSSHPGVQFDISAAARAKA